MKKLHSKTAVDGGKSASGKQHPAFEFVRRHTIDSLNIVVEEYRHRKTGAPHFHLDADSDENVFLVGLRTVPVDSTGVAHMLHPTCRLSLSILSAVTLSLVLLQQRG